MSEDSKKESRWSISSFAKKIINRDPFPISHSPPATSTAPTGPPPTTSTQTSEEPRKEGEDNTKNISSNMSSQEEVGAHISKRIETAINVESVTLEDILEDSPFLRQEITNLQINAEHATHRLQKAAKTAKQICFAMKNLHSLQREFSSDIVDLGRTGTDEETTKLFSNFGKAIKEIEEIQGMLFEQMKTLVSIPLEQFSTECGEELKERKKKFERCSQNYENATYKAMQSRKKSNPGPKILEAETEFFLIKKNYHVSTQEYLHSLNVMVKDQRLSVTQNVSNYVHAFCTFFNHGSSIVKDRESLISQASTLVQQKKKEKAILETQGKISPTQDQLITNKMNEDHDFSKAISKTGYLWMKTSGVVHDWKRRFVQIEKNHFKIYKNNQLNPFISISTLLCSAKETQDERLFSFEVSTPEETHHFVGESHADMKNWLTVLQNATFAALNEQTIPEKKYSSNPEEALSPSGSRHFVPNPLEILRKVDGNSLCADCSAKLPEWASINLGILICIQCSGVHRNMGTHISKVRSFTLDKCDENLLNSMLAVGNKNSNRIFESNVEAVQTWRQTKSPQADREAWIKDKYVEKKFVQKHSLSQDDLNMVLYQSAQDGDPLKMLESLVQGADPAFHNKNDSNQTPLHAAIANGNFTCAFYLTNHKAPLDARDLFHQTPLHIAALYNDIDGAVLLFKAGASLTAKDANNRTPQEVAAHLQKADCLTLLRLAQLSVESGSEEFTEAFESFSRSTSRLQSSRQKIPDFGEGVEKSSKDPKGKNRNQNLIEFEDDQKEESKQPIAEKKKVEKENEKGDEDLKDSSDKNNNSNSNSNNVPEFTKRDEQLDDIWNFE